MDIGQILTIKEVGDILKVTPRTIRQWIFDGKLKAFKLGGLVRIHHEDLDAFVDRCRQQEYHYEANAMYDLGVREKKVVVSRSLEDIPEDLKRKPRTSNRPKAKPHTSTKPKPKRHTSSKPKPKSGQRRRKGG